ncbi:MAG TPA: methionyl-tRNA formyltransferase [Hyphomicrobiales bacterium]|nr:methionyl-tRNA formyltransferase [Hyphomicrobiales bacterium]
MTLRLVFMGTPDFAVPTLEALAAAGHDLAAVYTRAPKPAGRGMAERKSPVHAVAERLGVPVATPKSLRDPEASAAFASWRADAAVVVAYGLILPSAVLAAPRLGCFNLHASLLPRWRGAAPINRAVMAGDAETGVTVMRLEEGLDTGPMCLVERVAIGPDDTAGDLHDRLAPLGADLMVRALAALERGTLVEKPQPADGVTYAAKIAPEETRIDWRRPAAEVHDRIRGLSPFPGAWCEAGLGRGAERLRVMRSTRAEGAGSPGTLLDGLGTVACGESAVRLLVVQRAGKAPMAFADFARGARLAPGVRLA